MSDELPELNRDDARAYCGRFSPSSRQDADLGESPRFAEGWCSFEAQTLVVDIPGGDFTLPEEVVEAIRQFDAGPVRCERLGPEITTASVREVWTSTC